MFLQFGDTFLVFESARILTCPIWLIT
jgi:hypothetical protein